MGLLDQVLGSVMGSSGGGSPMQGVLANLLGGGQQSGTTRQGGFGVGGGSSGLAGGGLSGLVSMFEGAGLGHIIQSWIGSGPNQPVAPEQLQSVLGDDQVRSMAGQAKMPPNDFLSRLSQHLPKVVDGMTPNGRVPEDGTVSI